MFRREYASERLRAVRDARGRLFLSRRLSQAFSAVRDARARVFRRQLAIKWFVRASRACKLFTELYSVGARAGFTYDKILRQWVGLHGAYFRDLT